MADDFSWGMLSGKLSERKGNYVADLDPPNKCVDLASPVGSGRGFRIWA
jgi:hypothetical protein